METNIILLIIILIICLVNSGLLIKHIISYKEGFEVSRSSTGYTLPGSNCPCNTEGRDVVTGLGYITQGGTNDINTGIF